MPRDEWLQREIATGAMVRSCYELCLRGGTPSAEQLHALCQLTWITKGRKGVADNTRAVIAPALSTLLGIELRARTWQELSPELLKHSAPTALVKAATSKVGMVNFYGAFRRTSLEWLRQHRRRVWKLFESVAEAMDDDALEAAYASLQRLPPLPRNGAGAMECSNMLTPVLACLDERGHAPIINSRKTVQGILRRLGLSGESLVEQYIGLRQLIGQARMPTAFALDTASPEAIQKLLSGPLPPKPTAPGRPLELRHDTDLEWFRQADTITMRRLHNTITNALREACDAAGRVLEEGSDKECLYDARILHYRGSERHLLVEVKTDSSAPMCRLAFGQLHDYRRKLGDRAATDLAVLFPEKPSQDALGFFAYVGVRVMWLDGTRSKLRGQVQLG